jgi:lipopolysaccharide export system permease protein
MALFLCPPACMKKLDKLLITSFLGPFVLTFLVVVFVLLMQHMLKYFDDIIGKDLGWDVLGTLLFYFAIFMTPIALPLAVLLSTLITFGNLGEHFELTAIKSLGVSLTRALVPILAMVLIITGIAYLANNYLVPKAALEAYSLLYDIKQKKPSLDLREGSFYAAIPDVSIKVNKKYPDGITLKGVVIYDHRNRSGNREVTVADSGRMFTILNNGYLKLELFRGYNYSEGGASEREMVGGQNANQDTFSKTHFEKTFVVFDLSSFKLTRTNQQWFQSNRIMRNTNELTRDMDSVRNEMNLSRLTLFNQIIESNTPLNKSFTLAIPKELKGSKVLKDSMDMVEGLKISSKSAEIQSKRNSNVDSIIKHSQLKKGRLSKKVRALVSQDTLTNQSAVGPDLDSLMNIQPTKSDISNALTAARSVKTQLLNLTENLKGLQYEYNVFQIQWHKILASSAACLIMFLIGAPLGSIIKRGGLGVPVLTSIIFFILFYVMSLMGEKWAKQEAVSVLAGVWASDVILLMFGLIFLRQARLDARLFESDFYRVMIDRLKRRFSKIQPT